MRRIFSFLPGLALTIGLLSVLNALRTPETPVRAGTAVRMDVGTLATGADLVLEARVLSKRGVEDPSGRIDTEYLLRVDRTLWGEPNASRSIRIPGGQLPDGRGMVVAGIPHMRTGEDVLLFLSTEDPSGMRMPVGLGQGKFTVARDVRGRRRLVRAPGSLSLVDPKTGRVHEADGVLRFDYASTVAEIEAALSVRRAAAAAKAKADAAVRPDRKEQ
jgi:hypothetical protein